MDKVNPLGAGIALAVTFALLSALCAAAFVIAPDATIDFFGAFMHGLDLKSVKAAAPLSAGKVLYGIIGLSIVGFIAGLVSASVYNAFVRNSAPRAGGF
jgi:2TM family of unknown function (DUF5676)